MKILLLHWKKNFEETAICVEHITKLWNILNVRSRYTGKRLNDIDREPINSVDDSKLEFLQKMATSLKLMDTSKQWQRINSLTSDTANAWHVLLNGIVDVTKCLLNSGMEYVLLGKLQSDRLENEFGIYRQGSGGNYFISVEQVISSLSLQRLKLYHQLGIERSDEIVENICCVSNLEDRDEYIELVESSFEESWNLTETELSTLYFISGYVANKEKIGVIYETQCPASEFTELVSRGGLSHPPQELFDLSQYLYCFFKLKKPKCCSKIFLQAYNIIYEASGYEFESIDRILSRFNNCFLKGLC